MRYLSISLIILVSIVSPSFGQHQRTPSLDVRGQATLKVKPDLTVVTISFNATNMEFNKAIKEVNDKNEALLKHIEKSGFKREEVKSSNFTANKNIVWSRDRSIDSGFVATQTVILEFAYNKERVGKLVDSFSKSPVGVVFNFDFTLSEAKTKETRNKLIELSITDAKEKAELIAKASTIKLGAIQTIQYGNAAVPPQPMMYKTMAAARDGAESTGFSTLNVNDIEMSDELIITWLIGQ